MYPSLFRPLLSSYSHSLPLHLLSLILLPFFHSFILLFFHPSILLLHVPGSFALPHLPLSSILSSIDHTPSSLDFSRVCSTLYLHESGQNKSTSQAQDEGNESRWRLHSFSKYWRGLLKAWKRGRGQPALPWSDSQERKLFRLISMDIVAMDSIAPAMYEPATKDKLKFSPSYAMYSVYLLSLELIIICNSQGACNRKWRRMTEILPAEVRIHDLAMRTTQKEILGEAFRRYMSTQVQSTAPVFSSQLASAQNIPVP